MDSKNSLDLGLKKNKLNIKNCIIFIMEINNNSSYLSNIDDEIDLKHLLKVLWDGKWLIVFLTTLFSIIAVIYSLSLPNIYQSKALLSPVGSQNSISQSSGGLAGMAGLAGINLSSSGGGKQEKAIAKLTTLSFFEDNILPNIFLPDLMAVKAWDASTNTIVYDEKIFNNDTQAWVINSQIQEVRGISPQSSHKAFLSKLYIYTDTYSGFATIGVEHQSPYIAKAWTKLIVDQLNYFFRAKDKLEAQASMDFLNAQIAQTGYTEIKQVIAQLLQQKTQQLTLIEASEFYVFSYLDPPAVMEEKIGPSRSKISILGFVLGALLGIFIILIQFIFANKKN